MKKSRWFALIVLCMGTLMIVLDSSIVNVALPSIKSDLGFSENSLAWIINAFTIAFAGSLLLGGRLGDLYGRRRWFLLGIAVFTLASIFCGLAWSQETLILGRVIQGIGGAVADAIALSLILDLFPEPRERSKAMGVFGFVAAGGGSIGVFLGGLLTGALNWHWIFLINAPIGVLVFIFSIPLLRSEANSRQGKHVDILGALSVTASLMLAVYAIVNGAAESGTVMGALLAISVALMAFFVFIESKAAHPLVPLTIFRVGNIALTSIIGILWSAGMFAWFFLAALYLQFILGYSPLQVGLSFLPANLVMALFSIGLSARLVDRFGVKPNLIAGMVMVALGLLVFSVAPQSGSFAWHVLPAMLLLGLGAGCAFNPVLLAGTSGISEDESGLASGVLNTAFMMGGALGLAILASVAAFQTSLLLAGGSAQVSALLGGYHLAFLLGALFASVAALLAVFLRKV